MTYLQIGRITFTGKCTASYIINDRDLKSVLNLSPVDFLDINKHPYNLHNFMLRVYTG